MTRLPSPCVTQALALLAAGAAMLFPAPAAAQTAQGTEGPWRWRASLYVYLPSVSGNSSFPTSGSSIDVSSDNLLDHLDGVFMGSLDVHNGRWGVFTDLIYLNLGDSKQGTRDFSIGRVGIPASTSANLNLELQGTVWTLAGQYRLPSSPGFEVDVLGGARMLNIKESLRWDISGQLGALPAAARSGEASHRETVWDAIVGAKGRYTWGDGRWSVPFYVDVGTGESDLTWQAAAGIGYSFSWGEITVMWRELSYDLKSSRNLQDVRFSGPMFGATFRL